MIPRFSNKHWNSSSSRFPEAADSDWFAIKRSILRKLIPQLRDHAFSEWPEGTSDSDQTEAESN